MTTSQRDELLVALTDAVAKHVLSESHAQALALSLERRQASDLLDLHARLIDDLDRRGQLDRQLEELPREEAIRERKAASEALTGRSCRSCSPTQRSPSRWSARVRRARDEYLGSDFVESSPASLGERFRPHMRRHPLRREIITTDLVNTIVDHAGTTFVSRLAEETGADSATSRARTPSRSRSSRCANSGARSRRSTPLSLRTPNSRCCCRDAGSSPERHAGWSATGARRSTSPRRSRTTPPGPPRCARRCRNC